MITELRMAQIIEFSFTERFLLATRQVVSFVLYSMDEKENTVSSSDEKTSSPLTPLLEAVKTISGTNTLNLPQINSLRLKPTKSTDSLTHHPLLNNDDEESDVISTWSSQRSRRSSSNSSSSSLQPRFSTHLVPGGSVGGLLLAKLREMNAGFTDIVRMLIAKKCLPK
jgi:hypothetical protein